MAIPIEGYCVVAQKVRIADLLEMKKVPLPNSTAFGDDELWRCSFMAQTDAVDFMNSLGELGLNVSRGPDPDVVIVNEFDGSVDPYCEWLQTAKWDKAVIGWKAGSRPEHVVAREGWDPKVGSGLSFQNPSNMQHLEFVRLEGNVEVFLNLKTGKEVFIGRTTLPLDSVFRVAAGIINEHSRAPGERALSGKAAAKVSDALKQLEQVLKEKPHAWRALWFHGKGLIALARFDAAYDSLRRAFNVEQEVEAVPRELAGVCLELGKFDEAIKAAQRAVMLEPDNHQLIANLALALLMASRLGAAKKSIDAAIALDPDDPINKSLLVIVNDVVSGIRPQPTSMNELRRTVNEPTTKKFWQFWRK